MKEMRILGVTIDDIDISTVRIMLARALLVKEKLYVVTPNPEILLYAHSHSDYRDALNRADLSLPDGRGLRMVSPLRNTVPGVDVATVLLSIANAQGLRVCCIMRADGHSSIHQIQTSVRQAAPNAHVTVVSVQKSSWSDTAAITAVEQGKPDIILVGLGFPEQELWLDAHLTHIPSATIGMAVGGAFDFWSGVATRAPGWMQRAGIEWLWRLVHEPRRWKRIWNAVVVFPFTALKNR